MHYVHNEVILYMRPVQASGLIRQLIGSVVSGIAVVVYP